MQKIILLLLIIIFNITVLFSADRGLRNTIKSLDQYAKIGKQYAVVIAINNYQSWNPLKGPVKDASKLRDVLDRRYYIDEFVELYNEDATKKNIIKLFKDLQVKVKTEDSVMIFYAGHGHLDYASGTGFWIPVNGGTDEDVQDNWLPNQQIRGLINNIKSRHLCLISDSCFSGDMLNVNRAAQPKIDNTYYQNAYKRISRQILTSGASETVSDNSDFAKQLVLALEGNNRSIIDPMMLFNEIKLGVRGQTPMFGELKSTGHQVGGSFLLFKKEEKEIANDVVMEESKKEIVEDIKGDVEKELFDVELEQKLTVQLDDILSSNKNSKIDIEGCFVSLDKVKKEILNNGDISIKLNKKIYYVEESLKLHKTLIDVKNKRDGSKKNVKGFLIGGSVLMGLGVVSGSTTGAMFGLFYDYDSKFVSANNKIVNDDITARSDALYNAEMSNIFLTSGIVMIPITVTMLIAGGVMYAIAPYDIKFKNQIDKIQNRIENFNFSIGVDEEKTELAFCIKF